MAIWGSDNDGKVKFLEEERVKLWTQLRALEGESRALKEETRSLKEESLTLKNAVNKKTSDYEAESKNAAKKAVEYKNKSEAAKETITQNLNKANDILTAIITVHETINAINSQINEIVNSATENHNYVVATCDEIKERKESIEEQITKLEQLFANNSTYASNIQTLESLATTGQATSTKIDALYKYLLSKKTEIDELYYEVIGYKEKDEETGEETPVPGLKDELEESYEELLSRNLTTRH